MSNTFESGLETAVGTELLLRQRLHVRVCGVHTTYLTYPDRG